MNEDDKTVLDDLKSSLSSVQDITKKIDQRQYSRSSYGNRYGNYGCYGGYGKYDYNRGSLPKEEVPLYFEGTKILNMTRLQEIASSSNLYTGLHFTPEGHRIWIKNKKIHRNEDPAFESADRNHKIYFQDGKIHREIEDGPAIEYSYTLTSYKKVSENGVKWSLCKEKLQEGSGFISEHSWDVTEESWYTDGVIQKHVIQDNKYGDILIAETLYENGVMRVYNRSDGFVRKNDEKGITISPIEVGDGSLFWFDDKGHGLSECCTKCEGPALEWIKEKKVPIQNSYSAYMTHLLELKKHPFFKKTQER
jgi:hypothetical protein